MFELSFLSRFLCTLCMRGSGWVGTSYPINTQPSVVVHEEKNEERVSDREEEEKGEVRTVESRTRVTNENACFFGVIRTESRSTIPSPNLAERNTRERDTKKNEKKHTRNDAGKQLVEEE